MSACEPNINLSDTRSAWCICLEYYPKHFWSHSVNFPNGTITAKPAYTYVSPHKWSHALVIIALRVLLFPVDFLVHPSGEGGFRLLISTISYYLVPMPHTFMNILCFHKLIRHFKHIFQFYEMIVIVICSIYSNRHWQFKPNKCL